MGIGGISIWQLLIILLIVVLLFGTKKLRNMGGDLGSAIKNFRHSVKTPDGEGEEGADKDGTQRREGEDVPKVEDRKGRVIEGAARSETGSHGKRS